MAPIKKASSAKKVPPKKKATPRPAFIPLPRDAVFANVNGLGCSIGGKPLSWKRVCRAKNGHTYNSQMAEMKLFADALFANFSHHNTSAWMFGDELVEIEVKFWFEQRTIPNDIDNLLKFVMDSLQKARIIDNDNQVVKVCMMKATGKENKIELKVFRHFMVDPSDYVSDGIVNIVYDN